MSSWCPLLLTLLFLSVGLGLAAPEAGGPPEAELSIPPALQDALEAHPDVKAYFLALFGIIQGYQQQNAALGQSYFNRLKGIGNPNAEPLAVFEYGVEYAKTLARLNRQTAQAFEALSPPNGFEKSHKEATAIANLMKRMSEDCDALAGHYESVVKPAYGTPGFIGASQQFVVKLQAMNGRYPAQLTALFITWQERFLQDFNERIG